MNTLTCPACQGELDSRSRETTCGQCQARYRIRALCPACGQELERGRACGAVDYFATTATPWSPSAPFCFERSLTRHKNPADAGFILCAPLSAA